MLPPGYIALMLIPALLIITLLWWRFYGRGKHLPGAGSKSQPGNYKYLKSYRYTLQDFVPQANATPGTLLKELISEDEYRSRNQEEPTAAPDKSEDTVSGVETANAQPFIPEEEEHPAKAIFYNPITAPAPTDNYRQNREAEIALKRSRRAALKSSTASTQAVFSELFSPDVPGKNPAANTSGKQ